MSCSAALSTLKKSEKEVTYSTTWMGQPWDVTLLCYCSSELRVVGTEPLHASW